MHRLVVVALGAFAVASLPNRISAQDAPAAGGSIAGVVYDSLLTSGPLRGATVYVIGTTHTATTDARGRFTIAGVASGTHTLTFAHPAFDSAGVMAPQVAVQVASPATAQVTLATPKGETLIKASCPGAQRDATGLLMGVVRDPDSGAPLPGATVTSRWFELSIDQTGKPRYETPQTVATADAAGVYRLCGLPADIPVLVRAMTRTQESGRIEVYFGGNDVAFRDFAISITDSAARIVADSLLGTSTDSTTVLGISGAAVVRGVVRDANGTAVPNARVGLLDRGIFAVSNNEGRFNLAGVPAGTQTLEIRAIGFAPLRQAVTLKSGAPTDVSPKLMRAAQQLANISVKGQRKDARLTKFGFEERRRQGVGFFVDADEIKRKSGIYASDVLRYAPGMAPAYTSKGRVFTMRSVYDGNRCSPTYFLDGSRWFPLDGDPVLELDRFIQLNDLYAVEVYSGNAKTPAQFDGGRGCGSVVFWTKQ